MVQIMCKKCEVHGCNNPVYKPNKKYAQVQRVCRKHYIAKQSGRVGANWERDIHNFHRKGYCEVCGITAGQLGLEVIAARGQTPTEYRFREIINLGMQNLEGHHINGREGRKAHHPENIQTLCATHHKIITIANEDHKPVKHRKYRRRK